MFRSMLHSHVRTTMWVIISGAFLTAFMTGLPCRAAATPAGNARAAKSANEIRIAAALDEKTELDFTDQPLSEVIDFLKQRHGIEIQIDHNALADAGVGTDTPITRAVKGIALESALDLMFCQLDLAWVIHDEVLFITTKSQAEKMIETRVYPVRDLLTSASGGVPGTDESDYDSLLECLADAAAHDDGSPDPGAIRVFRPSGALVITRPILVHYRIEKLLRELRAVRAAVP